MRRIWSGDESAPSRILGLCCRHTLAGPARVTAVEDFYRKRFIYQLTREGEAAEAALSAFDEALGRRGALRAVALHDIVALAEAGIRVEEERELDLLLSDLMGQP